jgi:hypothetical protein
MSKPTSSQSRKVIIEFGTIMAVLAPLLYTAGWSYLYKYFDRFHLGLSGLDIPKEYIFLYSFRAIGNQFPLALIALLIAVAICLLTGFCFGSSEENQKNRGNSVITKTLWQTIGMILIPILILSLFGLFYHIGDKAAQSHYIMQAEKGFSDYPRVKVWLKEDDKKQNIPAIAKEWEKGCYCLLLRSKDHVYLFYPWKLNPAKHDSPGKTPTEIIPAGEVMFIRTLPWEIVTSEECN